MKPKGNNDYEHESNCEQIVIHSGFSGAGFTLASFFNRSSQCFSSSSHSSSFADSKKR